MSDPVNPVTSLGAGEDMFGADIQIAKTGTPYTTDSSAIDVINETMVGVLVRYTGGNASFDSQVDVYLSRSPDGTYFSGANKTDNAIKITVKCTGAVVACKLEDVYVKTTKELKITYIDNNDATYTADSFNVTVFKTAI